MTAANEEIAIDITGCRPAPFLSYLKGLGLLRILSTQQGGVWRSLWSNGDAFQIIGPDDADSIVDFFLNQYAPTPVLCPWNGGSGFYEGDSDDALNKIRESNHPRFGRYRETIEATEALRPRMLPLKDVTIETLLEDCTRLAMLMSPGKPRETFEKKIAAVEKSVPDNLRSKTLATFGKKAKGGNALAKLNTAYNEQYRKAGKADLLLECRARWPDEAVSWLDAVAVLKDNHTPSFSPLLGTGGNEGRLEYGKLFMELVCSALMGNPDVSRSLLQASLFQKPSAAYIKSSIGQLDPGRAGGYNQGMAIESKDAVINPWDFILGIEGCVMWSGHLARRQGSQATGKFNVPFCVSSKSVGYGAASTADEERARAELWAPLWMKPATFASLVACMREGRAQTGVRQAQNTIEFAEAASLLGVDRGITGFQRHLMIQNRGQSFIALSAGRFQVSYRSEADLLRELEPLLMRVDRVCQGMSNPPARFLSARNQLDRAMFQCLNSAKPDRLQDVLRAIGTLEQWISQYGNHKEHFTQPISGLSPRWLEEADNGGTEFRIAAALASIVKEEKVGPIRANLCPVDPEKPYQWGAKGLQHAWQGRSFTDKLSSVLARRLLDASKTNCRTNPLRARINLSAADVMPMLYGHIDESRCEQLLFGMMWIDWGKDGDLPFWQKPLNDFPLDRSWCLLKLLFLPGPLPNNTQIKPESSILPLLQAGRFDQVCQIARRRLFISGQNPYPVEYTPPECLERLPASLLLPTYQTQRILDLVCQTANTKTQDHV